MLGPKIYHILLFIVKYNHLVSSMCWVSVIVPQHFSDAKSLSEKFSSPKGDPGTCERQQGHIIVHLLLPADEQPAKAVPPGVRPLHHPAARPVAWDLALRLAFLAAAPNVGRIAPLFHGLAHRVVVVALVPTHVLRPRGRRLGALDHHGLQRGVDPFHLMAIGASYGDPERHPLAVGQHAPCGPKLAAIGGILAHLFPPPRGALVIAPSIACPSHSSPCRSSYRSHPSGQRRANTRASRHS